MKKSPSRKKWVLLNPGPVNVTPRVRAALAGPDLCHREEEFSRLAESVRRKLLGIFGVRRSHTAVLLTGSGTAAVEAMMRSRLGAGKTLVISNGLYGERLAAMLAACGAPHAALRGAPGVFPDPKRIETALKHDRSITAVAMVHHETSTGMLNPLGEVGRIVKKCRRVFLVDAVSSLGAEKIDFAHDGIDLCAGSAGKCLHGFPGVSFVIVSTKEAARLPRKKTGSVYLDLGTALGAQLRNSVPFTPAVPLFYAFDRALEELVREGLPRRIALYRRRSALLAQGFKKLGLRFLVPEEYRSHVLAALRLPRGTSYARLHAGLKKRGFVIYAGRSKLAGRIFRVANLGDLRVPVLKRFLTALGALIGKKR